MVYIMRAAAVLFCLFLLLHPAGVKVSAQFSDDSREGASGSLGLSSPEVSLGAGSSISSSAFGNFLTTTLSPSLRWKSDGNFSLITGARLSGTNIGNMSGLFTMNGQREGAYSLSEYPGGSFMSATVYAIGSYQVNPRLSISGGTWVEKNSFDPGYKVNNERFNREPMGMVFGFDYKVSENFSFGAGVNVSRGYDPFSPFNNFQHSPFGLYSDPFRQPHPAMW